MGDYTGLVCKIKVKPEYYDLIDYIQNIGIPRSGDMWVGAFKKFGYPFLKEFSEDARADFIPHGGYILNENWLCIYIDHSENYFKDGVWFFGCNLKNYADTIDLFLEKIISEITEEVCFIKSHFEHDEDMFGNLIETEYKLEPEPRLIFISGKITL